MRYMLLIYSDEAHYGRISPEEYGRIMAGYGTFHEELEKAGKFVEGARLRPTGTATTVRVRAGATAATDGPFAETKEHLGGYYLIEATDLDEALTWAAKLPTAHYGSIEVRPVWEMGEE